MKQVDVDTLLEQNKLELTIAGKRYVLTDLSSKILVEASKPLDKKDSNAVYTRLAVLLGEDKKVLEEKVGMVAAVYAMNAINDWLTAAMQGGQSQPVNPLESAQ